MSNVLVDDSCLDGELFLGFKLFQVCLVLVDGLGSSQRVHAVVL